MYKENLYALWHTMILCIHHPFIKIIWTHARKSEAAEPAPTDVEEDGTVRGAWGRNRATFLAYGMIQHDETLLNRLNISKLRRRYEMDQDGMGWGSVVGASDLMICMYDMYVVQSLANHGLDVNKETSRGGSEGHWRTQTESTVSVSWPRRCVSQAQPPVLAGHKHIHGQKATPGSAEWKPRWSEASQQRFSLWPRWFEMLQVLAVYRVYIFACTCISYCFIVATLMLSGFTAWV